MFLLFATLTVGPLLLWLGLLVAVMVLSGLFGCQIDDGGVYPCTVLGAEIGRSAAILGIWATWAPMFLGPIVVLSGLAWGLVALIGRVRRLGKGDSSNH